MHRQPKPQDQARIFKAALKELNLDIKHQDALRVLAKTMGFKDWPTMAAAEAAVIKAPESAVREVKPSRALMGPKDGDIYEGMVTIGIEGISMSALMRVRAHSLEEAQELLPEAGSSQFPEGFEIDEGNPLDASSFYLGDEEAVENLSEVQYDRHAEDWGSARWQDERFEYVIMMNRLHPDNGGDEEAWSQCEIWLTVSKDGVKCEEVLKDYECHRDDLSEFLEERLDEGDFHRDLKKLAKDLAKKLNLK